MLLPRQGVSHSTQKPQGVALGYVLVGPAGRPSKNREIRVIRAKNS